MLALGKRPRERLGVDAACCLSSGVAAHPPSEPGESAHEQCSEDRPPGAAKPSIDSHETRAKQLAKVSEHDAPDQGASKVPEEEGRYVHLGEPRWQRDHATQS